MNPFPIRRGCTRHTTKRFGEVALIGKTVLHSDIGERVIAVQQHFLCPLHSIAEAPLIWRKPRRNLKSTRKLGLGETYELSELVQANVLREIRFEEFQYAS
jgi:hypothetical protein